MPAPYRHFAANRHHREPLIARSASAARMVGLCSLATFFALSAQAQTAILWLNSGSGTNQIDVASNWTGGAVPTSSQVATFSGATFSPNNLQPQSASVSFAGISLLAGSGPLTFTGPGGGSAKKISIGSSGV